MSAALPLCTKSSISRSSEQLVPCLTKARPADGIPIMYCIPYKGTRPIGGTSMSVRETHPNPEGHRPGSLSIIMNFMPYKGTRPIGGTFMSLRETHPNPEVHESDNVSNMTDVIYNDDDDQDIIKFCKEGDFDGVKRCINADSQSVNVKEWSGLTPLHWASINGRRKIVQQLLQAGANKEAKTRNGRTPLHSASRYGQMEVAQLLVQEGIDSTIRNNEGQTGLEVQPVYGRRNIGPAVAAFVAATWHATPMHKTCYENDVVGLQALLTSISDNTEAFSLRDQHGWTPLHVAVFMNRVEVTKLLISKGAKICEVTGNSKLTALHLACSRGLSKIVIVLLGLDVEVPRKRKRVSSTDSLLTSTCK